MELDQRVHWPDKFPVGGASTAGDNVIYSARPGDVPFADPGDVNGARRILGWYKANAASTFLVQERGASSWLTINGPDGLGVPVDVDDVCEINVRKPAGVFRLVVNFAVAPTTYEHSTGITLCPDASQESS